MLHWLDLVVFDRSSVPRVVSVKSDHLGPSWLALIKFDPLLDWLSMNNLVGETGLRFYQAI
jgi:hypothetical protein